VGTRGISGSRGTSVRLSLPHGQYRFAGRAARDLTRSGENGRVGELLRAPARRAVPGPISETHVEQPGDWPWWKSRQPMTKQVLRRWGEGKAAARWPHNRVIAASLGVSASQVRDLFHDNPEVLDGIVPGPRAPLPAVIHQQLDDWPWRGPVDYEEAEDLGSTNSPRVTAVPTRWSRAIRTDASSSPASAARSPGTSTDGPSAASRSASSTDTCMPPWPRTTAAAPQPIMRDSPSRRE
jgi:hypothetical protein